MHLRESSAHPSRRREGVLTEKTVTGVSRLILFINPYPDRNKTSMTRVCLTSIRVSLPFNVDGHTLSQKGSR